MEWPALLAATARLLDLHDCDRAIGSSLYKPPEHRPGTGTGIWLHVATALMRYLYEKDLENNEAWVPIDGAVEELVGRHDISREDVLFVANYLSTPTRLISIKEDESGTLQRQTHKRETALIEWPANTQRQERCRLSPAGTRSVLLSQAAQNWLYAADDASKLERAVDYGAFADIPQLAEGLVAQIRRFSKEITSMLERQHMNELLSDFTSNRDNYIEVIKEVQLSVERAGEKFRTKQVRDRYMMWLDSENSDSFTAYTIQQSLTEILQAIERLSRKFQMLVSALASTKRDVIGLIRFDQVATGLAFHPCSNQITELCISAIGPWVSNIAAPLPMDFSGILSLEQEAQSKAQLVFDDEAVSTLPTPIERFLEAYREEILVTLKSGPVSLSEAISKGWLKIEDTDLLPQLIGVYASPDWLSDSNKTLAVSLGNSEFQSTLPDGSLLEGDNIIMHWLDTSLVNERNKHGNG